MDFPYFFKLKTPIEYDGEQIEQFVFDELEQSALTNIRTFVERSDYPPSASQKRNALEYLISQMIDEPEQIFKFVSDEDFKRIIHFLVCFDLLPAFLPNSFYVSSTPEQ